MDRIRLLIADDSAEMRRNLRLILALEQDIQVEAMARDGAEAVDLAVQRKPDVALIDLDMPKLNGLAAIRAIREKSPATMCIVVSAEGERGFIQQAMASGAREYFVKPVEPEALIAAIRRSGAEAGAQQKALAAAQERDRYLRKLAEAYAREKRTDDEAVSVYAELAARPDCEVEWLITLAAAYFSRREWGRLRAVAERLEQSAHK